MAGLSKLKYLQHLEEHPPPSSRERETSRRRRVTRGEASSHYGNATWPGIAKAVSDLYPADGLFPPFMPTLDERTIREVKKSVKADKRSEQEEERKCIEREHAKADEAHALRFSDVGMAASVAEGTEDKVLPDQVNCLVPVGCGYDSSTGDSSPLNPYTKKRQTPQKVHGILGGCVNRLRAGNSSIGSVAGVAFSRATGSSAADECAGIIRSAEQRDVVRRAPDLSSSDESYLPLTDIDKE